MSLSWRRSPLLGYVIVTMLCAAGLVGWLQRTATAALDRERGLSRQRMAEQRAEAAADELRAAFDGPVFDTLSSIDRLLLQMGDFEMVADTFAEGLVRYPHVDRFLLWHELNETSVPGEALFYGREHSPPGPLPAAARFTRDPAFGRRILAAALEDAETKKSYSVRRIGDGDAGREIFLRFFYSTVERTRPRAVLGFVVDLDQVRNELFVALAGSRLRGLLESNGGAAGFELRVFDEAGRPVYGPPDPASEYSGSARFSLRFYPHQHIATRMASVLDDRVWTLTFSPPPDSAAASSIWRSAWLSGLTVLLLFVALGLVVHGHRRSEQLAQMQSDFVAHVSHQLKTPLTLLHAITETLTLERARSPQKLAQYLEILQRKTSGLLAQVERVLEFARVEDGSRRYDFDKVDLAAFAAEVVEALRPTLSRDGVSLRLESSAPGPIVVADAAALEQALLNLIDNAVKYSPERREIVVRVGVRGGDAFLEVRDHGRGVPEEERSRIFDRFYRGRTAGNSPGFGLGLTIASKILRAHRGTIEAEPNPAGGSIFRVCLPMRAWTFQPIPARKAVLFPARRAK